MTLELILLLDTYAVCRLPPEAPAPAWLPKQSLASITWTRHETSIVCLAAAVPANVRCEPGWRALEVAGPLDFALTGVLSSLLAPLAQARVPVFTLSTYDTDYLLVREAHLTDTIAVLSGLGHALRRSGQPHA